MEVVLECLAGYVSRDVAPLWLPRRVLQNILDTLGPSFPNLISLRRLFGIYHSENHLCPYLRIVELVGLSYRDIHEARALLRLVRARGVCDEKEDERGGNTFRRTLQRLAVTL